MSKHSADDLEAVRGVVAALDGFQPADQERILRWAREKVGLSSAPTVTQSGGSAHSAPTDQPSSTPQAADIRAFVQAKNPQSDTQFAATVAYFYRFEAPAQERKESVTADDLQDATRKVGRERLVKPSQTLINAHGQGLLDKAGERGAYAINTVGENLVAMALPGDASGAAVATRRQRRGAPRTGKASGRAKTPKKAKAPKRRTGPRRRK